MITIFEYPKHEPECPSGQIEFLVFYDKVKNLVDFYNFSLKNYNALMKEKQSELDNIENTIKEIDGIEGYEYEYKMFFEEDILGKQEYYLEFQKMNLIVFLYSEIEKLIDNLFDILDDNSSKQKINRLDKKLRLLVNNEIAKEIVQNINELRKLRNELVHAYDYWYSLDKTLKLGGNEYENLNQIDDSLLGQYIEKVLYAIEILEEHTT